MYFQQAVEHKLRQPFQFQFANVRILSVLFYCELNILRFESAGQTKKQFEDIIST